LRSREDIAACAQEANGKNKPDKHVGRLTVLTKKASSAQASNATPNNSTYMVLWVINTTQLGVNPLKKASAITNVTRLMMTDPNARPPNAPELASRGSPTSATTTGAEVVAAMFYPIAVLIVATVILSILMVYVIPKFKDVFAGKAKGALEKEFGVKIPPDRASFILGRGSVNRNCQLMACAPLITRKRMIPKQARMVRMPEHHRLK